MLDYLAEKSDLNKERGLSPSDHEQQGKHEEQVERMLKGHYPTCVAQKKWTRPRARSGQEAHQIGHTGRHPQGR